eukprot:TRINITY_DN18246_c0_g1_i3.p1 TRINITY_DN18246_c0_g1~~TRINITY_DN18246_c0_g1_i3.p1  ORF type:complete len:255 (-),score=26.25 TRINITY_DN18246_c0_g1_i3:390-1070(-)
MLEVPIAQSKPELKGKSRTRFSSNFVPAAEMVKRNSEPRFSRVVAFQNPQRSKIGITLVTQCLVENFHYILRLARTLPSDHSLSAVLSLGNSNRSRGNGPFQLGGIKCGLRVLVARGDPRWQKQDLWRLALQGAITDLVLLIQSKYVVSTEFFVQIKLDYAKFEYSSRRQRAFVLPAFELISSKSHGHATVAPQLEETPRTYESLLPILLRAGAATKDQFAEQFGP